MVEQSQRDITSPIGGRWLTVPEVARVLRVNPATVRRWAAEGEVRAVRIGPGGHWRIPREALDEMLGGSAA